MSEKKTTPPAPQPPSLERLRESYRPGKVGDGTRVLDQVERKNDTTVFRTRPIPDPGKK